MREFNLDQFEKTDQGCRIRKLRKYKNIGLRQAARIIGCTATDLSRVETGKAVFEDDEDFERVIDVLGRFEPLRVTIFSMTDDSVENGVVTDCGIKWDEE